MADKEGTNSTTFEQLTAVTKIVLTKEGNETSITTAEKAEECEPKFTISKTQRSAAYADYYCDVSKPITALLIGRSQSGKSSILEALKNPLFRKTTNGFSETREPQYHSLILYDEKHRKPYQLNIIDTPGLNENARDPAEQRTNAQLLDLAKKFIEENVTTLNCVCFVSQAGKTHQDDIEVFDGLMEFFGEYFSDNTMMILTHCDGFKQQKANHFHEDIKDHPISKKVYGYCKLGLFNHGIVDHDELESFGDDNDFRDKYVQKKIALLAPLREKLMQKLISTADSPKPIIKLQQVINAFKAQKEEMVKEIWENVMEEQRRNKLLEEQVKEEEVRRQELLTQQSMQTEASTALDFSAGFIPVQTISSSTTSHAYRTVPSVLPTPKKNDGSNCNIM